MLSFAWPCWILTLAIESNQQCENRAWHWLAYIFLAEDWGALLCICCCLVWFASIRILKVEVLETFRGTSQSWNTVRSIDQGCQQPGDEIQLFVISQGRGNKLLQMAEQISNSIFLDGFFCAFLKKIYFCFFMPLAQTCGISNKLWYVDVFSLIKVT